MNESTNSNNEVTDQIEEEEIEEGIEEELKVDSLGFFCFLIFVLIVFFLLLAYWTATYPFGTYYSYSFYDDASGSPLIYLYDQFAFYVLYWIGFICLLIGLVRYKYEFWLIILVAILGTMVFFMFFF